MSQSEPQNRQWLQALLLSAVAFLPVLFGLGHADRTIAVDIAAALTAVAGLVAAYLLVLGRQKIQFGLLGVIWAVFLAIASLSSLLSGRGWSAFMGEASSLAGLGILLALTLITVAGAVWGEGITRALARYGWMALGAESLLALLQKISGAQGAGTLPNSSYLGIVAVALIPWVLPALEGESRTVQALRTATVIATLGALAATGSRVALAVCLVWSVWAFLKASSVSLAKKAGWIAVAVVVVVALSLGFAKGELAGTFSSAGFGDRPGMWKMATYAVEDRPILGWGPDGYMDGAAAISTPELGMKTTLQVLQPGNTDPHNALVWLAVSTGALGLVAALAFAVLVIVEWNRSRKQGRDIAAPVWAVCGVAVCALLAPLPAQVAPLCALMLGVSLAGSRGVEVGKAQVLSLKAVYAGLAVLVLVFGFDAAVRSRIELPSPERSPQLAASAQSAARLLPFDPYVSYLAVMHWGFAGLSNPALNDPARDNQLALRAGQLDQHNPFYALVPVRLLVSSGAPFAQVQTAFQDSFARYPVNPFARAPYAAMLAQQGKIEEAKEQLRIAKLATDEGNQERLSLIESAQQAIQQAESNSVGK